MCMNVTPNTVYLHHKGGRYLVLCVADESTNIRKAEGSVVVYVSLTHGRIKVRDVLEFLELVRWPDGEMRPRFVVEQ